MTVATVLQVLEAGADICVVSVAVSIGLAVLILAIKWAER
jgi:hypothetical protein